jgi:hypothetical protein
LRLDLSGQYSEARTYTPGGIEEGASVSLEVDLDAFAVAHACGAVVIDLREPYEYASGHVPGARLIPLGSLPVVPGRRESVA